MKEIEVIIYMGIKERFEKVLEEEKIEEYIIAPKVLGRIKGSDPRLDTHVWPGYFITYCFCMEDGRYEDFRERLFQMERDWEKEGFLATVRKIEERCGGMK